MVSGSANIFTSNPNFNFQSGFDTIVHYNQVTNFTSPASNISVSDIDSFKSDSKLN